MRTRFSVIDIHSATCDKVLAEVEGAAYDLVCWAICCLDVPGLVAG